MKVQRIYSKNAAYQKFEVLKTNRNKRFKYQEFLVEGVRNINEAIKNNWKINSFLYSFERKTSDWALNMLTNVSTEINFELTDALMRELSGKEDTSEIIACIQMRILDYKTLELSSNPIIALFDRPSNKGNLGAVIRSCDAIGVEALAVSGHAVDIYDPETIVATMGSFFKLPVLKTKENQQIQAWITLLKNKYHSFQVIGTTAHSDIDIYKCDFSKPTMFLIGNETDGLSAKLSEFSDVMVRIPMSEGGAASSFNVACAATVMFYEAIRQRRCRASIQR